MRPFKWIFRIIFTLITLLIVLIVVPIALLYKNVTPPPTNNNSLVFEEYIDEQIANLVDENNDDKILALSLDEETINTEIKNLLIRSLKDNLLTNDQYIAEMGERILIQGAWVKLNEDIIEIEVGAHFDAEIMVFKSRALIALKIIETTPSKLVLKIDKLKLGNLPLKWVLKVAPKILENFFGKDLDEMIEEIFSGFGTYNQEKQEITVDIKSLLKDTDEMLEAILKLIEEEKLIFFGVNKKNDQHQIQVGIDLNKIKSHKNPLSLFSNEKIKTEKEFNNFMSNKALTGLIKNQISFNDKDFLKILNYLMVEDNSLNDYLIEKKVYNNYTLKALTPYFEINNKAVLNIPIFFGTDTDNLKVNISLDTQFIKNNNDLVISLSNAEIGELIVEDDLLNSLISNLSSENTLVSDFDFKIKDFFTMFNDQGFEVKDISISKDMINFNLDGINVNGLLNEIIADFTNDEVKNIASDLLNKIENSEEIIEELEKLTVEFETLSDSEKDNLMLIVNKYFK